MEIIKSETNDYISIKDIDPKEHIVVGVNSNEEPLLLTPIEFESIYFKALLINKVNGNSYKEENKATLIDQINRNCKRAAAFKKEDWKKALIWLTQNAKD